MISRNVTWIIIFIYETSLTHLLLDCKNSSMSYILRSCVILEKSLNLSDAKVVIFKSGTNFYPHHRSNVHGILLQQEI